MFVIVTYDIGVKRVSKVMKICRKYLKHVQRSVFEGMITESKLRQMQEEIRKKINIKEDQVCIYELSSLKYSRKEVIGLVNTESNVL